MFVDQFPNGPDSMLMRGFHRQQINTPTLSLRRESMGDAPAVESGDEENPPGRVGDCCRRSHWMALDSCFFPRGDDAKPSDAFWGRVDGTRSVVRGARAPAREVVQEKSGQSRNKIHRRTREFRS